VSERVDFIDNVIISVTVFSQPHTCLKEFFSHLFMFLYYIQIGPPNASYIKSTDKSKWSAKDVADSVLADRSSLVTGHFFITYGLCVNAILIGNKYRTLFE